MCLHMGGLGLYSLIQRTFVESAQNMTLGKSHKGGHKAQHMVTHLFGDHTQQCLTLAFQSEYTLHLLCTTDSLYTG